MQRKELEKIFNHKISDKLWQGAQRFLKEHPYMKESFVSKNDPEGKYNYLIGYVTVDDVVRYRFTVVWLEKITEQMTTEYKILTCRCSCSSHVDENKLCVHLTGFLINVRIAGVTEENSWERLSQEEKDEQTEFYKKIVGEKKQGRAEIGFSVKTWHDKNNGIDFFVFSNFYVYTPERFIRYLKIDELFDTEGNPFYEVFNEIRQKTKLSENSKNFIDFISGIGKLKKSDEYINREEGEIIIPEILVPKAVVFLRNMAKNYSKNILFPAQTCISAEKEFYTLKFENFCRIIPVGKEYAAVKDNQGNKIAVYNVGDEKLEKIKYLAEFEKQNKVLKLAVKTVVLKELLETLGMVSAIVVGKNLKKQIIIPKKMRVQLQMKESYSGKIWISPNFIYDGKSERFYKKSIIVKDINAENEIFTELEEKLFAYGFERANKIFYLAEDDAKTYEFMTKHIKAVSRFYEINKLDGLEMKEFRKLVPEIGLAFRKKIVIKFSVPGIENKDIKDIFDNISAKKKYYQYGSKGLYYIYSPDFLEFEELLTGLNAEPAELKEGIVEREKSYFPFIKNTLKSIDVKKDISEVEKNIYPKFSKAELPLKIFRTYQRQGMNALIKLKSENFDGVLADDMGLGKKVQIIACLYTNKKIRHHLILTFSFMTRYWENEFKKYLPLWKVKVVEGSFEERMKIIDRAKMGDVLIASYNNFATDFLRFRFMSFGNIIYDEALYIRNREKFAEKAVYLRSDNKYCLTGGFSWDNFGDIYHLFALAKPGYLGNRKIFENRYIKIGEAESEERKNTLLSLVEPYIIHRKRIRVKDDLPRLTVKNIIMDMDQDKRYRKLYIKYLRKINRMIIENNDEDSISQRKLFAMVKRLGQICSHPRILQTDFYYRTEKMKALDLFLQKCIDEDLKTVVLTQYDSMLEIFREKFKRKWKNGFVNLKMSSSERNNIYNYFKTEKDFILFAGRIDFEELTATDYDVIIYYDPPWKDKINKRIENDYLLKNIIEINLIIRGTMEEKVLKQRALARNDIVTDMVKSLEKYSDINLKGRKRYGRNEVMELFQL